MKNILTSVLIAAALLGGHDLSAQTQLTAVVGLALPPYVIKEKDNGLEVDIVRQALKYSNYTLKLQYVPFARVPISLGEKSVDCALTINESSETKGVFYSQSHITYQNVVVGLKSKNLKIASITDLKPIRVVAFQGATNYLGAEFAAIAKAKGSIGYSEIADQEAQVKMLFIDHADVLVMDINIFKYFRQAIKDMDVSAEITYYQIFTPTQYKVAFTSKEVRDKFDDGLAKLKASGKYMEIFKSYIK